MIGQEACCASPVVRAEGATVQVATTHHINLHGYHSLAGQTFFVRNEEQAGIFVPGRQQIDNKYKKRSVEDITMSDNALELV